MRESLSFITTLLLSNSFQAILRSVLDEEIPEGSRSTNSVRSCDAHFNHVDSQSDFTPNLILHENMVSLSMGAED